MSPRPDGQALFNSAEAGDMDEVKRLLVMGADVNHKDDFGWTPLHFASYWDGGHVDVIKALIDHGADANAKDKDGWTPLHLASHVGHVDAAKALIDNGANVSAKDDRGRTPQHLARDKNNTDMVHLLVDAKYKPGGEGYMLSKRRFEDMMKGIDCEEESVSDNSV